MTRESPESWAMAQSLMRNIASAVPNKEMSDPTFEVAIKGTVLVIIKILVWPNQMKAYIMTENKMILPPNVVVSLLVYYTFLVTPVAEPKVTIFP